MDKLICSECGRVKPNRPARLERAKLYAREWRKRNKPKDTPEQKARRKERDKLRNETDKYKEYQREYKRKMRGRKSDILPET